MSTVYESKNETSGQVVGLEVRVKRPSVLAERTGMC